MALHLHPHSRIKIISAATATAESSAPVDNTQAQDIRLGWIEQFIRANNLAKNTQKTYRLELERFATWSNKAWADVTPRDIARFKHYLMTECKTRAGKPLMPASVNQALAPSKASIAGLDRPAIWT